jgi:STAS-like domain of unknown function (DUF4325)/Bacterial regulatory proteins, gntR family
MSKLPPEAVRAWVTKAIIEHPTSLARQLAIDFHVSRPAATAAIARLVSEGWLIREGTTRPRYSQGAKRQCFDSYKIPGVDEAQCWERDYRPYISMSANVEAICFHAFTEMVNNANDHSGGSAVSVLLRQDEKRVQLVVTDDGMGVFERISTALNLPDKRLALLELSKGKFTTDPERHSGEGIFFTSKMFDKFTILSNGLVYEHNEGPYWDWLVEQSSPTTGTSVFMLVDSATTRTTRQVFDTFAASTETFEFDKTIVPVRLARLGNENLISRSQAKRLIARFERFRWVVLDFQDVPEIGQAFADEVFRVFAKAHPNIVLGYTNAIPTVEQMINRVKAPRV